MSLDLRSVGAKLKHGAEYADSIKAEFLTWMKDNTYGAVQQVNADSTEYRLIARLIGTAPPLERWSLMIGDSIHNIRCALDHLVYTIAVHESKSNPPPNEDALAFPICKDRPAFTKAERKRLRLISPPVRTAIESVQPYNRRHPSIPPPLAILRDLDDTDKHRLLRLALITPVAGDIRLSGPQTSPFKEVQILPNFGEIKDSAEIVRHVFDSPTPNMSYDRVEVKLALAIWHGKLNPLGEDWTGRNDFASVLPLLIAEVKYVIDTISAAVV